MSIIKDALRFLTPSGLIELHRRRFRLQRLGISASRYSASELDEAMQICRFELWPPDLRNAPHNWVLVDVGANVGDYVAAVLKLVSPQRIIAIEPLPSCHSQLASVLANNHNNLLVKAAAGEARGEVEMYYTGDSKMSSLLAPQTGIADAYKPGDYATRQKLKVPLVRIDDVVPVDASIGLLKLDVQGFELSALRGAEATLKQAKAIQVEINYTSHYEGAASFDDVHGFLAAKGFKLYGVSAPYFGAGRPLWPMPCIPESDHFSPLLITADINTLWRRRPFEALGQQIPVLGLAPMDPLVAWRQHRWPLRRIPAVGQAKFFTAAGPVVAGLGFPPGRHGHAPTLAESGCRGAKRMEPSRKACLSRRRIICRWSPSSATRCPAIIIVPMITEIIPVGAATR